MWQILQVIHIGPSKHSNLSSLCHPCSRLNLRMFITYFTPESPERPASVLILGEAGSGKTTVIRDICRKISASEVRHQYINAMLNRCRGCSIVILLSSRSIVSLLVSMKSILHTLIYWQDSYVRPTRSSAMLPDIGNRRYEQWNSRWWKTATPGGNRSQQEDHGGR